MMPEWGHRVAFNPDDPCILNHVVEVLLGKHDALSRGSHWLESRERKAQRLGVGS